MNDKEIDELVFRFQEGDGEAGERLLRIFGGHPEDPEPTRFIGKYYLLLRYGKVNFKDRDTRRFIMLFIDDPEIRKKLIPFYQYKEVKSHAIKKVELLVKQLEFIPDEDLIQDLRVLFLTQVKKYNSKRKGKVRFTGYLYNSYRYVVKNHVERILKPKDPLTHKRQNVIHFQDDRFEDENSEIEINDRIFNDDIRILEDDELGNNWVRGITCGEEFRKLNPFQRLILKLHYEDGYSDGEIGEKLGLHINTIFRQRRATCQIVQKTVQDLIKEGYYD